MKPQAGWWLETAQADWRAAQVLHAASNYSNAAFHLQQAAEKVLKALLCEVGERSITHSSLELMVTLQRLGDQFPVGMDTDLRRLDRCYIDSRYPNGVGGPPTQFYDAQILEELFACCQRVMDYVRSRLNWKPGSPALE